MIRAVVFDCFGVLVGTSYFTFRDLCPPERHKELADAHLATDYGFITQEEYAARVGDIIGMDHEKVREAINRHHTTNKDLLTYVKRLRQTHKTALLSNVGSGVIETIFSRNELAALFDEVVLSYQVRMVKPDPEIFKLAAQRLALPVDQCLMIDDRQEFCDGADAAGMPYIRYESNNQIEKAIRERLAA